MAEFSGNPKTIAPGDTIRFENAGVSTIEIGAGVMFRADGDYIVSVRDGVIRVAHYDTPRWIPVEERMPEKHGEYLVIVDGGDPPGAYVTVWIYQPWSRRWADDDFVVNPQYDGNVTYWMPLPELPYGEK